MLQTVDLRTEYLKHPIGITFSELHFSWKLKGETDKYNQY